MRRPDVIAATILFLLGRGQAVGSAMRPQANPVTRAPPPVVSHCTPDEMIVYTCPFRRATVSVCMGESRIAYRYGRPGKPEMEISSNGKDGRAYYALLRGQGNGEQVSIRFTNGDHHYSVYSAIYGDLTMQPGERSSGLVVEKGGSMIAEHHCPFTGELQRGSHFRQAEALLPEDPDAPWF